MKKTFMRTFVLAWLAMCAAVASGQDTQVKETLKYNVAAPSSLAGMPEDDIKNVKEVDAAFSTFVDKLAAADAVQSASNEKYGTGYMKCYTFKLPKSKKSVAEDYSRQMQACSSAAYYARMKKAGTPCADSIKLVYGENNGKWRMFQNRWDTNSIVLLFKNSADNTMRFAYTLEWRTTDGDMEGEACVMYGTDPTAPKKPNAQDCMRELGNLRSAFISARKREDAQRNILSYYVPLFEKYAGVLDVNLKKIARTMLLDMRDNTSLGSLQRQLDVMADMICK